MDIVGIRVPTRQIKEFSAQRHSPSARFAAAANDTQIFRHI
jgi:hypothetical protein